MVVPLLQQRCQTKPRVLCLPSWGSQHRLLSAAPQQRGMEGGKEIPAVGSLDCRGSQSSGMLTQSVCPLLWDSCSNSSVNLLLSVFNKWQQHFPFLAPPGLYPDITGDLGVSVPAHQHLHPAPALLDPAKAWENISAVPWVPLPHFIEFSVLQAQQWLHHSSCSGGPRKAAGTHLHWNCPFPCTKTTPFPFPHLSPPSQGTPQRIPLGCDRGHFLPVFV